MKGDSLEGRGKVGAACVGVSGVTKGGGGLGLAPAMFDAKLDDCGSHQGFFWVGGCVCTTPLPINTSDTFSNCLQSKPDNTPNNHM